MILMLTMYQEFLDEIRVVKEPTDELMRAIARLQTIENGFSL
jgi:hypothetical protein